jgi:hypothetical protein
MVTSISVALHGGLAELHLRGRAVDIPRTARASITAHLPEHPQEPVIDSAEDAGHDGSGKREIEGKWPKDRTQEPSCQQRRGLRLKKLKMFPEGKSVAGGVKGRNDFEFRFSRICDFEIPPYRRKSNIVTPGKPAFKKCLALERLRGNRHPYLWCLGVRSRELRRSTGTHDLLGRLGSDLTRGVLTAPLCIQLWRSDI